MEHTFVYVGPVPSKRSELTPPLDQLLPSLGSCLSRLHRGLRAGVKAESDLYWLASWFYEYLPEEILNEVRNRFFSRNLLKPHIVACAGQCFAEESDCRLFFDWLRELAEGDHRGGITADVWLRAYRNLARFRPMALTQNSLSQEAQSVILDLYLEIFEGTGDDIAANNWDYLHCVYLAPHVLKRRRHQSDFMKENSPDFTRFKNILEHKLLVYSRRGHLTAAGKRQKKNVEIALLFLRRQATRGHIEEWARVEAGG